MHFAIIFSGQQRIIILDRILHELIKHLSCYHVENKKSFFGGSQLEMSFLFLQLPDQTKFCFDVTIFIQTTQILQSAIQYWLKKMRDIHMFTIFLDSAKLKIVWIKITTFFKRRVSIIL